MKTAPKQMKRKAYYVGPHVHPTYSGSKTQPGSSGQPTGSKLSRKAAESRCGARTVGVVSKAYEQMSKDRRAA